ncbi:hypothetical protein J4Q44_G00107580 [Coregonus suidteri]|uniref:Uncharacterized protein n=1 Tax=Coregonus suidteri TaxID=861788 RepID=A0AAN8M1W8_9TELE
MMLQKQSPQCQLNVSEVSEVRFIISISILNPSAHNESLKCDRLKFQKDRKRPESCHPFHPEENAMECGRAAGLSAPLTAALLPLLATLISR